jgi:hypothetical protein
MECGIETVQEWINRLLGKDHHLTPEPESASPHRPETPPNKKVKGEPRTPTAQSPTIFFASQPPPSPMRHPPPHLHPPPSLLNPLAPAQPSLPFLPLFNQTATQRRVTVEYPAEFSGPSHAGRWTVQCVGKSQILGLFLCVRRILTFYFSEWDIERCWDWGEQAGSKRRGSQTGLLCYGVDIGMVYIGS